VRSGNLIKGLLRNKHNAQSDISNAFCRWIKAISKPLSSSSLKLPRNLLLFPSELHQIFVIRVM